jgi:four helix bundle protein
VAEGYDTVTEIYRITKPFPKEEVYGLTNQLCRAAVSIRSNLAEGCGRNSRNELHHFTGQARGSLLEVETQLQIAANLRYLEPDDLAPMLEATAELGRIINGLLDWSASAGS